MAEPQSHDLPVTRPQVSIKDMIAHLREEAYRIESTQRALLKEGLRAEAHPERMGKVAAFDAAADILEVVLPYWEDVTSLVRRLRNRGRY